jgi:hypothetical protein
MLELELFAVFLTALVLMFTDTLHVNHLADKCNLCNQKCLGERRRLIESFEPSASNPTVCFKTMCACLVLSMWV